MEALAVISLLSNIIQFIEVGDRIVKTAKEIRESSFGTTIENERLQRSASELRKLSEAIDPLPTCPPDSDQQALERLAQDC